MSFDQMDYEDFSWIRWDRMRWDLVNAIAKVSMNENYDFPERLMSTGCLECLELMTMLPQYGTELGRFPNYGHLYVEYAKNLQPFVTDAMREGMMMLSPYIVHGTGHPLKGHLEAPWEIARIVHSPYFTNVHRGDKFAPHVSDEPSDEIRELLYSFVKLAFPDQFLTTVHKKNSDESFERPFVLEETWFGEGLAWKRLIIRPFFGEPGLIQGFLMDSEYPDVEFREIDLSHVKSLGQAIREIRGIDLTMYDQLQNKNP